MTRSVLVLAVLLAGCGGTMETDPACNWGKEPILDGTHAMSIAGECSGGTLTISEVAYPGNPCSHELVATWTCGSRSGTTCPRITSFRSGDYVEIALCDGATEFWHTGLAGEAFEF